MKILDAVSQHHAKEWCNVFTAFVFFPLFPWSYGRWKELMENLKRDTRKTLFSFMPSFCIHFCPLNRIKFVFIPLSVWFICRLNRPFSKRHHLTSYTRIFHDLVFLYKLNSWWFINLTEITKGVFYWPWIKVNGLNSRNRLFWRSLHYNL